MRVYDNGLYRDLTEAEKAECTEIGEQPITDTERINALEEKTQALSDELTAAKIILGVE